MTTYPCPELVLVGRQCVRVSEVGASRYGKVQGHTDVTCHHTHCNRRIHESSYNTVTLSELTFIVHVDGLIVKFNGSLLNQKTYLFTKRMLYKKKKICC